MMFARGGMMGFERAFEGHCLGGSYGYYGGPIMMFIGLLVIAIIAYLFYRLNTKNNLSLNRSSDSANSEALDVLKMKFVNGEITEEDYLRKRNLLLK
jgi:putative membrane protein